MSNFIFGIRSTIEAIKAGKDIDKILIKHGLSGELYGELFELIKEYKLPTQLVPIEKIERITRKNHQGIVAFISEVEFQNEEEIVQRLFENGKTPLIILLDSVTDIRNFGAIARTAECAGVDAIIMNERGSAPVNADAVKTSAGALHLIPVCRTKNMKTTIHFLRQSGLQVIAASEKAVETYYQVDYKLPTAILMGAEDKGIANEFLRLSDKMVQIPILGKIESLNVSVAAGVILYEAVRQRIGKF